MSSDHDDQDIESQQTAFLTDGDSSMDQWPWIFLMLCARSIHIWRADRAEKASTESKEDADLEQPEIVEALPGSPQVVFEVRCDGMNGANVTDVNNVKLQHANIAQIVKAKDSVSLQRFGGIRGIAEALDTDLENGIPGDEEDLRSRCIIDTLSKAEVPARGLVKPLLRSSNSYIIFLLCVSAAMSIGFGVNEKGLQTGLCQGVIIILAVIILVVVSLRRNFWHMNSKPSEKHNPLRKRQSEVDVLRGGNWQTKSNSDVVTGDVVSLRRGCYVPGDGLFISGECLKVADSLSTIDEHNPFLYYGAKVINGHSRMLVTSVGMNTAWGEMMSQVTQPPSNIKLPTQLDKLGIGTQIIGLLVSILIPIVVFLHFKLGGEHHDSGIPEIKGQPTPTKDLMDIGIFGKTRGNVSILTTFLAMLVIGIMEGVPFAVSIANFYWNKKALSDKAFAQESLACVSMGSVTTICTENTGGLTLDQHEVGMCWIGEEVISEDSVIDPDVLEALCNGISAPVLMLQGTSCSAGDPLISWATSKLGLEVEILKQCCSTIDAKQLSLCDEVSGMLMMKNRNEESHMCLHYSGPAKTILTMCSFYYDSKGTVKSLDDNKRSVFELNIEHMQSKNLKTLAFAYKIIDFPTFEDNSFILIGLIGLKHNCPTKTRKATKAFTDADVNIILISEEDVSVLKAIELECGLLHNMDKLVLEAEVFRRCTDEERLHMVDNISAIGNALPSDKLLLVQCLKQKGHTVAMVGARTNDTPALKEANVGIAMGSWSSELARESSDIVVWDGDFNLLLIICGHGRCAYNNIQKYIQFEVTLFVVWSLVTIITTAAFGDAPVTTIHWCWTNLVVAFPGGLALLTEPPSKEVMDRPPLRQTDPLITKSIWRNIITQSLFQAAILVTFQFICQSILHIETKVIETMVFNSFVLLQVFNLINSREPNAKNVFEGIHCNLWFRVAVSVTMVTQVTFNEIAHILIHNTKLNGVQWGICVLIGILSLLIDFATKSILSLFTNSHTGSTGMTHSESQSLL